MNNKEVNILINDLDWNLSEKKIENAINKLVKMDDDKLHLLLQPRYEKRYWHNAAIVIKRIGYPRIKIIIPGLLEWLQDMNWPGATTVVEILSEIDKDILIHYLEAVLIEAKTTNDTLWITWIKEELIEKMGIVMEDFIDENNYKILDLSEW